MKWEAHAPPHSPFALSLPVRRIPARPTRDRRTSEDGGRHGHKSLVVPQKAPPILSRSLATTPECHVEVAVTGGGTPSGLGAKG